MLATSEEIVPFAAATAATTTAATATAATAAEKTAVVGAELAAAGVGAGSAATEEKPAKDGAGISAESVVAEGSTDLLPKEDLRRKEEEVNIETEAASVKEEAVELKQEAVSLEPETVKLEPALAVGIIAEVKMEETVVTKAEDEEEQHKVELGALEVPQPEKVEVKTPRRGRCF